jgi:hypothetical protein
MRYSTKEPGLTTKHLQYPAELNGMCLYCGSEVEEAYVTAGHRYTDFSGDVNEIRHLMRCTNPACELYNVPYNPTPSEVLPFKQYSLAVWKWIAGEYKLYNQNAGQIQSRAKEQFGLDISANTIRNYMDAIDVLVTNEIDLKTAHLLKIQGIILLALDGQKPEEGGKALWIFVDLVSNRVLKVAVLDSADSGTLHEIVEGILRHYHVKIVGMVSDKQNNLTKLHDDWYPDIPQQFCHFHFLQNLWNHVEVKDTGLHQQLSKGVKHLRVVSAPKQASVDVGGGRGKVPVREVFKGVEQDLRRIVKGHGKKFECLRGAEAFQALEAYAGRMDAALAGASQESNGMALLRSTAGDIRQLLEDTREAYADCQHLNQHFQAIRAWLGEECPSKGSKLSAGDGIFKQLWEEVRGHGGAKKRGDLRTFLPHKGTPRAKVEQEFVRLYDSYRDGLFAYYAFPAAIRANSPMEEAIGEEKGHLRQRAGKANVSAQIRTRGEFELKQVYAGRDEVKSIIRRMGPAYSPGDLKAGLQQLASRRATEAEGWHTINAQDDLPGVVAYLNKTRNECQGTVIPVQQD